MRRMRKLLVLASVVGALLMVVASTAFASTKNTNDNSPAPTCPKGYSFDKPSASCKKIPPPSAGQTCTTAANGVTYCNQVAQMTSSESDRKVATLKVNSGGVMQLRWAFPAGWKPTVGEQKSCHWVVGGTNSYVNSAGKTIPIPWAGKKAYICPSASSPSGWRKAGGPPTWEDCGNVFWPKTAPQPKNIYYGRYKIVQNFNYTVTLSLKLTLHGTVSASARCTVGDATNGASASGTATGTDSESIVVSGTGTGRTLMQATNMAHQAAINSTQANNLRATVTATASYKMTASASASCQAPPPVAPTCTDHSATNYGGALPCQYPNPSPTGSGVCTGLTSPSLSGNTASVTANYSLSGTATFQDASFNWGDGNTTGTQASTTASHTYGSAGTRTITATLRFGTPSGVQSSSCSTSVTINTPAPSHAIAISSSTTLNDIPATVPGTTPTAPNQNFTVTSTDAFQVTVDPGIAKVAQCSQTPQAAVLNFSQSAGTNVPFCLTFVGPSDPSATSTTITVTVTIPGTSAIDKFTETVAISHSTRP